MNAGVLSLRPAESKTTHSRADLSPAVRELLRGRMERHGDSMRDLAK